jgi:hypothetical protein
MTMKFGFGLLDLGLGCRLLCVVLVLGLEELG